MIWKGLLTCFNKGEALTTPSFEIKAEVVG